MSENQRNEVEDLLKRLYNIGLLEHIILIGSWAERFYHLYLPDFSLQSAATRDIDFYVPNPHLQSEFPVFKSLREMNYFFDEDLLTNVIRFTKSNLIDVEFLTKDLSKYSSSRYVKALGFKVMALRELSFLEENPVSIVTSNFTVKVPQIAALLMHKILIYIKRPKLKQIKDLRSIQELIEYVKNNQNQINLFTTFYLKLTRKQNKKFWVVVQSEDFYFVKTIILTILEIDFEIT